MEIGNTQNIQGNTGVLDLGKTDKVTTVAAAGFQEAIDKADAPQVPGQTAVPGAGDKIAPVDQTQQTTQGGDRAQQIGTEGTKAVSELYRGIFKKIQEDMPKDTIKKAIARQKEQENEEVV